MFMRLPPVQGTAFFACYGSPASQPPLFRGIVETARSTAD
jgi:hypothetical protein